MMDAITVSPISDACDIQIIRTVDSNPNVEMYTEIISCQESVFDQSSKSEAEYANDDNQLGLIHEEYQSALKSLNNDEKNESKILQITQNSSENYDDEKQFDTLNAVIMSPETSSLTESITSVKTEQIQGQKTDDESMAVEALRQLGGMYNSIVTTEQDLPLLPCNICEEKFHTTADLHAHFAICNKNHSNNSYTCTTCREVFDNKQEFNDHGCYIQETYTCRFCSRNFFRRRDLQEHINTTHQGERPYKCPVCNLDFPRPSSLTNHLKIHRYQPGREIFSTVMVDKPGASWTPDHLSYVIESSNQTDPLSTWNFNYSGANNLVQTELGAEVNLSVENDLVIDNYVEDVSEQPQLECADNSTVEKTLNSQFQFNGETNYSLPSVKVETTSFLQDVENMDETFPISSIPQMEVTVGSENKRTNICPHCGTKFTRQKALMSHIKLHMIGWQNAFECESCGEAFTSEQLKREHKENCLLSNTLLTATPEDQKNHIQLQSEQLDYGDLQDDLEYRIQKTNTTKSSTKIGKHPCPDCNKRFTTKQKMYRHMWIHRKKTFTCELCAMTFELQSELDTHRLSQHPADTPYVCQECGKCFASRQGLWEHGRVHGGGTAGLFNCTQCTKTFASRQGYLIHNRTHTGERPYGCRFCLKAFRDGGTLRKHERIHTGERPHVCPICLHDFNQKVVLREHVRWVHIANKVENENGFFVCQICSINISDKEELCAHIVKHSDQMAAEAKDATKNEDRSAKTNRKENRKVGFKKKQNSIKVETPPSEENQIETLESDGIMNECEQNLTQFELSLNQNGVECDMCGSGFSTQKELMTHVRIHI